jgi:hypothetical protein
MFPAGYSREVPRRPAIISQALKDKNASGLYFYTPYVFMVGYSIK